MDKTMMRNISFLLLFLCLVSCDRNYIKDYKIEGIGIGDSLLNKHTKVDILKYQTKYYQNSYYKHSAFFTKKGSRYNQYGVTYEKNDNKFIIKGISGYIIYKKNFYKCNSKQEEITKEISKVLNITFTNSTHTDNKSTVISNYKEFKDGSYVSIQCKDWNQKTEKELEWVDNLEVSIISTDFSKFLQNKNNN